ncbi:MAG TPA: zinc-ribbon domain containing protein [Limnochordia bacterium]
MAFADKVLKCRECGVEFVFTAGEQAFYAEKGFTNEPSRCRDCRAARKRERAADGHGLDGGLRGNRSAGPRRLYKAVCAECGAETEVPFQPRGDRPVYCRECFAAQRQAY